jgi:Mycotoxin biosynthesis protein UstYa
MFEPRTGHILDFLQLSDHCIESIRQSLACSSDISVNNYRWSEKAKHMKPRLEAAHTCRNFEKIREWAFDRYVDFRDDRKHVENGKIVDYSYVIDPKGPIKIPDGFYHTKDEFMNG